VLFYQSPVCSKIEFYQIPFFQSPKSKSNKVRIFWNEF
jgi:hypothetical protein